MKNDTTPKLGGGGGNLTLCPNLKIWRPWVGIAHLCVSDPPWSMIDD